MAETVVLIAAGGTGGHIFPGLAIAEQLVAAGAAVVWMGAGGMEGALVAKQGYALHTVRYKSPRRWWQLPLLLVAVLRAWGVLRRVRPSAVLCMGGYASVPAGLATWLRRTPLIVHEQNAVPGRANRLLARFATHNLSGFETAGRRRVGTPVRAVFYAAVSAVSAGRQSGVRNILVLGGSQGAQALNEIAPEGFAAFAAQIAAQDGQDGQDGQNKAEVRVVHQCGAGNGDAVRARYAALNEGVKAPPLRAEVHEFIDDVAAAMAAADVVVCRAGAATLAELAAVGVGAVLVPYPHAAADHQTANARQVCDAGAAVLCAQAELSSARLAQLLAGADVRGMAAAMAALATPEAAREVAKLCLSSAGMAGVAGGEGRHAA